MHSNALQKILPLLIMLVALLGIGALLSTFTRSSSLFPWGKPGIAFKASPETVIKEMQQLQRLETASFTIEKVIEAGTQGNPFQEILYGDRILLIAHGQVVAGVDLSKLDPQAVSITGPQLTITLPATEIFSTSLDNSQSRIYDRRLGLLSKGDKDLESQTRQHAEELIQQAACDGMILTQAATNASQQLEALFKGFGFTEVVIQAPAGSC
jgi:hypothetical protein